MVVYCLIKYLILIVIVSKKFVLKELIRFFVANVIVLFTFLLGSLIVLTLLNYLFIDNLFKGIVIIYGIVSVFLFYPFMNKFHLLFIKGKKRYIKETFKMLKKVKKYGPIYLWSALLFIVYMLVFAFLTYLFGGSELFIVINRIVTIIFGYSVVAYNRFYFYLLVKRVK